MTVSGEFSSTALIRLYVKTRAVSQHQASYKWISQLENCSIRVFYRVVNSSPSD